MASGSDDAWEMSSATGAGDGGELEELRRRLAAPFRAAERLVPPEKTPVAPQVVSADLASTASESDPELRIRLGTDVENLYIPRPFETRENEIARAEDVVVAPSDPDDPGEPGGSTVMLEDDSTSSSSGDEDGFDAEELSNREDVSASIRLPDPKEAMPRETGPRKTYHPKHIISPCPTIKYSLVQKWLSTCDDSHNCGLQVRPSMVTTIMVVDCVQMRLVPIQTTERYLALSYVWGNVPALKLTRENYRELCTPAVLDRKASQLSRTVEDAIRFVRLAGEKYLWVDRLCIAQDHVEMQMKAIEDMQTVYRSAWAVIIAGSGDNTDAGLPGVCAPRPSISKQSGRPATLSQETLAGTIYEKRAWTYQERLLAQRRIVFLNDYMLFQCPAATFRDDIHSAANDGPFDVRFMRNFEAGMSLEDFQEPTLAYQHIVHSYCRRNMSFEKDILRAFAGISNRLGELLKTRLIFGIPEERGLIIDALCWRFKDKSKLPTEALRRIEFPSWSWCGWKAECEMQRLDAPERTSTVQLEMWKSVVSGPSELRIGVIKLHFRIGKPRNRGQHVEPIFMDHAIIDNQDLVCGHVQLPSNYEMFTERKELFIALKDNVGIPGKDMTEVLAYNAHPIRIKNGPEFVLEGDENEIYLQRPFLSVMMIQKSQEDRWERLGMGYIYRAAPFRSEQVLFDDNFVLA